VPHSALGALPDAQRHPGTALVRVRPSSPVDFSTLSHKTVGQPLEPATNPAIPNLRRNVSRRTRPQVQDDGS
jgi:hypothetical protein